MKISENPELLVRLAQRLPECKKEKLQMIRNRKTRASGICAWALLSYALEQEWGRKEWPPLTYGTHGKPEFTEQRGLPWFNLSHTDGWVLCVTDVSCVGGDIQKIPAYRENTVKRYASLKEWEVLKKQNLDQRTRSAAMLWTMKEAYAKYLGTGLTKEIFDLDFSRVLCGEPCITWKDIFLQRGTVEDCFYIVCTEKKELPVKNIRIEEIMQK